MYCSKRIRKKEFSCKDIVLFAPLCGLIAGILLDVEVLKIAAIKDNSFLKFRFSETFLEIPGCFD